MDDILSLAERLQAALWAYHNTDTPIMSDDEYDILLERLRVAAPGHPLLTTVGATPSVATVTLPVPLASLDKVRMGESALQRWQKRRGIMGVQSCVTSEKLDGLSGLYSFQTDRPALYLRGNGVKGVDVSRILTAIPVPKLPCMVRGEIVLPKADTPPGSIGRSLVNGWVHRSLSGTVPKELAKVHFVGYQVITPAGMTRSQQMTWLNTNGFRTPAWKKLPLMPLLESSLYDILVESKAQSAYPLDGIVVGTDTIPVSMTEVKNPPDAIAFKASLEEQKQETTVVFVEWNVSRLGVWIPRIQIEPVVIGGAKIEWLSGHSAKMITEGKIGKGARIVIRRSGDVIPTLDSVLMPCPTGPCMPPGLWTWDANHVHAVAEEATASISEKALLHALQTLGIEGIGPGLVANLMKAGIHTFPALLDASDATLKDALGPGRYITIKENLKKRLADANMVTLFVASNLLPRGVGERKLRPLIAKGAPRRWSEDVPEGWSKETLDALLAVLPDVIAWCESVKPGICDSASAPAPVPTPTGKTVVFTGVRPDAALLARMQASGWEKIDNLTQTTNLLVHADGSSDSAKIRKARGKVEICSMSEFQQRLR